MSYNTQTQPQAGAPSNDRLQARLLLDTGMAMAKPIKNPDQHGQHFVIVPEGHKVEALPAAQAPKWPSTTVRLRDAASFIRYVSDHKAPNSRIYATVDPAQFLAVIDDHLPPMTTDEKRANWREFRAEFKVPASREWLLWNGANRKHMSQLGFAEFLQDNLPDVVTPDGATLLEMSLNFEASQAGSFVANQRMQDGSHNLQWRADNNASGTVKLPEQIALSIPVFENESPSMLYARLRYRINDGKLAIWYELIRPHKVLESAFQDTWKRIADGTGVPLLLGTPE